MSSSYFRDITQKVIRIYNSYASQGREEEKDGKETEDKGKEKEKEVEESN